MSVNFLSVKITDNPKEAISRVLISDLDADKLEQIWITDESLMLAGYVNLADLLKNPSSSMEELLHPITSSVYATDDKKS